MAPPDVMGKIHVSDNFQNSKQEKETVDFFLEVFFHFSIDRKIIDRKLTKQTKMGQNRTKSTKQSK